MNKTFKIVFNKIRGAMMVVDEATRSAQKKGTKCAVAVAALSTMLCSGGALAWGIGYREVITTCHTDNSTVESGDAHVILAKGLAGSWPPSSLVSGTSLSINNLTLSENGAKQQIGGIDTVYIGNISLVPETDLDLLKLFEPAEIEVAYTNSLTVNNLSLDGRASFTATNNIKQAAIGTITTADGESAKKHASITLTDSDGDSSKITGNVVLGKYATFTSHNTVIDNADVTVGAGAKFTGTGIKDGFNVNTLTVKTDYDESTGKATAAGTVTLSNFNHAQLLRNPAKIGKIVAEKGTADKHAIITIDGSDDNNVHFDSEHGSLQIGTIDLGDYAVLNTTAVHLAKEDGLAVAVKVGDHASVTITNYVEGIIPGISADGIDTAVSNISKLEVGTGGSFTADANVKVAEIESSGTVTLQALYTEFSALVGDVTLHDGGTLTVANAKLGTSEDSSGNVTGKVNITLDAGSTFSITKLLNTPEVGTLTIGVNEAKDKIGTLTLPSTAAFKSIDKIVTGDGLNDGTHKYVSLDVSKTETLGALELGDYTVLTANAKTVSTTDTDGIQLGSHVNLALTAKGASSSFVTGSAISTPKLVLSEDSAQFTANFYDTVSLGDVSTVAAKEGVTNPSGAKIKVAGANSLSATSITLDNKSSFQATGVKQVDIGTITTADGDSTNHASINLRFDTYWLSEKLKTSTIGSVDLGDYTELSAKAAHFAKEDGSAVAVKVGNNAKATIQNNNLFVYMDSSGYCDNSVSNISKLEVGTGGSFTATANVKVASIESSGLVSLSNSDTGFSSLIGDVLLHDGGELTAGKFKLGKNEDAEGTVTGKVDITLEAGSKFTIGSLQNEAEIGTLTIGVNEAKNKVAIFGPSNMATFKSIDKIVTGHGLNDGTHEYVSLDISKTETLGALELGDYTVLKANAKTVSTEDADGIQLGSHVNLALTAKDASSSIVTGSAISTPKLALSEDSAQFTANYYDTVSLGNVSVEKQADATNPTGATVVVSNTNSLKATSVSLDNKSSFTASTGIKQAEIGSITTADGDSTNHASITIADSDGDSSKITGNVVLGKYATFNATNTVVDNNANVTVGAGATFSAVGNKDAFNINKLTVKTMATAAGSFAVNDETTAGDIHSSVNIGEIVAEKGTAEQHANIAVNDVRDLATETPLSTSKIGTINLGDYAVLRGRFIQFSGDDDSAVDVTVGEHAQANIYNYHFLGGAGKNLQQDTSVSNINKLEVGTGGSFTATANVKVASIESSGAISLNKNDALFSSQIGDVLLHDGGELTVRQAKLGTSEDSSGNVSGKVNITLDAGSTFTIDTLLNTPEVGTLTIGVNEAKDKIATLKLPNTATFKSIDKIVTGNGLNDVTHKYVSFDASKTETLGALVLGDYTELTANAKTVSTTDTDGIQLGSHVNLALTAKDASSSIVTGSAISTPKLALSEDSAQFTANYYDTISLGEVSVETQTDATNPTGAKIEVSNANSLKATSVSLDNKSSFTAKSGVAQFVIDSISCTIGGSADKHAVIEVADADDDETTLSRVGTIDLADYAELTVEKAYIAGEDKSAVAVSLKKGAAVNLKNATATSKIGTLSLGDSSKFNAVASTIDVNGITGSGTFQLEASKATLDGEGAIATLGTLNLDASSEFIAKNVTLEVGEIKGSGSISVGFNAGGTSGCTYGNVHVKTLSMNGGSIYVDPAYGETSTFTVDSFGASNTLNTNVTAGPNGLVAFGVDDCETVREHVNSNIENKGSINAHAESTGGFISSTAPMIYVARSLTLGTQGSLTADPTTTVATGTPQTVSAKNGGVIVIDQEKVGVHTVVFSGANSITVADSPDGTATSAIAVVNIVDGTTMIPLTDVASPEVLGNNFHVYTDNPYVIATLERDTGIIWLTERATDDGLKVIASMGAQAMANRIDTVLSRTVSDRFAMPRDLSKGKDLWANVSGEHFEQDSIGAGGAFKANMGYGAFGLDVYPTKNTLLGVAFQYSHGTIKGNSYSVKNKLKAYSGALYAGYTFETTGIEVLGELAYTLGKNDVSTSYYDGLKQKFDTKTYSAGLTVQRKFDVGAFDITPSVGVRVSKIKTDAIEEGLIESAKQSQTLVAVPVAIRFTAKPIETESGWLVSPKFKLSVTPTFGDKKIEVFGSKCTVIDTNPVQGSFGIGFTKGNFSTDIEANFGTGRQGTTSLGGKIGVNYRF